MDDKIRIDQSIGKFDPDSSWTIGGNELADGAYFFGSDREHIILSEFGWNLRSPGSAEQGNDFSFGIGGSEEIDRSDLAGICNQLPQDGGVEPSASVSNPTVSSSSSEETPEKSIVCGERPPTTYAETV
ncbi:uncharacterized protein LOC124927327 [Impatiens glandulifera]|uniref:uncharacterized protein LOC124927327 n=1 Tax=Impatiens glandulifera TaxID=253017 RepID=UPI001FB08F96|nr:uncharacterized protein LOC124927327 [Impatiens glandulifera]